MKKMRSTQLGLSLVVLIAGSCGFPRLPELADGGVGAEDGSPPPLSLELLAGDIGGPGSVDGTGADARFSFNYYGAGEVAVDSAGNVYVTGNQTIRKVTVAGIVTTLAGVAGMSGSADGTGANARFHDPSGVAADSAGNGYIADRRNCTIRKVTPAGVVTTLAGTTGMCSSADGTGAAARLGVPTGLAMDSAGNLYVAEPFTIRKVTAAGVVTTLAGGNRGSADGTGAAAGFDNPYAVAVDSAGNVYVADTQNSTIRKVTATGVVTTLAGTAGIRGSEDGTGAAARFFQPDGVAVDSAGNVYIGDNGNNTIRKITPAGVVTTLAGASYTCGSADGTGPAARFCSPAGVAVDSAGNLYVADAGNHTIRKVTATGVVTTLAGAAGMGGSTDGTGAAARFGSPSSVGGDSAGNVYVAGYNMIRKVTAAGVVTTLAGTAGMYGSADGLGAAARFGNLTGVAVDSAGNIYAADGGITGNNTIRKVTSAGVVTTLAGTAGMAGSADGMGTNARFNNPSSVAVDSAGNVYVADQYNSTIRKVTATGVVTTLAGTAGMGGSADGTDAAARFNNPSSVAVDSAGNVYVADQGNHTIRKVPPTGVVTTLAGTAGMLGSADGTGAAARFNNPSGVAVDSAGNIYVADQNNSTIRKVTPTGITTTIAGTAGVAGILLGAAPRFAFPQSLAIVGDSIIVSDTYAILLLRHGAQ